MDNFNKFITARYGYLGELGVCYKCANTNGPWILTSQGWLCEDCEEKENGKRRKINTRTER